MIRIVVLSFSCIDASHLHGIFQLFFFCYWFWIHFWIFFILFYFVLTNMQVEELASLVRDNLRSKHLVLSVEEGLINFLQDDTRYIYIAYRYILLLLKFGALSPFFFQLNHTAWTSCLACFCPLYTSNRLTTKGISLSLPLVRVCFHTCLRTLEGEQILEKIL